MHFGSTNFVNLKCEFCAATVLGDDVTSVRWRANRIIISMLIATK